MRRKLTKDQVEEIRRMHASGKAGYKVLGRMFGVSAMTARDVVKRRTHRN